MLACKVQSAWWGAVVERSFDGPPASDTQQKKADAGLQWIVVFFSLSALSPAITAKSSARSTLCFHFPLMKYKYTCCPAILDDNKKVFSIYMQMYRSALLLALRLDLTYFCDSLKLTKKNITLNCPRGQFPSDVKKMRKCFNIHAALSIFQGLYKADIVPVLLHPLNLTNPSYIANSLNTDLSKELVKKYKHIARKNTTCFKII